MAEKKVQLSKKDRLSVALRSTFLGTGVVLVPSGFLEL